MFLLFAEILRTCKVAAALPGSAFWAFLCHHQSHVEWAGCSLHDLIQPSFSFLVGVALPFSLARRSQEGQPGWRVTLHAFSRALILVLLGVLLRSIGKPMLNWTFEDTLTQIGLGYGFLFMLARQKTRWQWAALFAILLGYWLAFAVYPAPGPDFDWAQVGGTANWPGHFTGFASHWNRNSNFAWAFDTWFLNLFPREQPFVANRGGYSTLSFIPTLGTMILGLLAGRMLRSDRSPERRTRWLVLAGLACLASGWLLGATGICPVVKRIWTPSWTLFSGGWCFLLLAAFYTATDVKGSRRWAFFLVVLGANSITAYCLEGLCMGFLRDLLRTVFGAHAFECFGPPYEPFVVGSATLLLAWLIMHALYRKKIFLRI